MDSIRESDALCQTVRRTKCQKCGCKLNTGGKMRYKFTSFHWLIAILVMVNSSNGSYHIQGILDDYYNSNSKVGNVAVKSVSISIQSHGSYLDIIEQAIINPHPQLSRNDVIDYWVEGSVSLPKNATIVQFTLTDSSETFSSRIFPVYKENYPIDSTLEDPLAIISIKGVNKTKTNYRVKIRKITLGGNYKIAFRYLVPNSGNAKAVYDLQVIADNSYSLPKIIEFNFKREDDGPSYILNLDSLNFQLNNNQSLQIPYKGDFRLLAVDDAVSKQHLTTFEEGTYKGRYLLFNTSIPDSVFIQLCKPIELVYLWRWNEHNYYVKKDNYSWLTRYGRDAVEQAEAINSMIMSVASTGNDLGLVHSIQYKEPKVFPLCKKGSGSFNELTNYLAQINEEYLLNSGYYYEDMIKPTNPGDTLRDSSRYEFLNSINLVKGLYSNGAGIMKHLIIVTCGPVKNSRDIITLEELESLISDITVSCEKSFWRDVNFTYVKNASLDKELISMSGFKVPQFRPSSLILQISNTEKTYSFPLSVDQNSFSIIAKSEGTWSPKLTWYGFDKSGAPFDTAHSVATVYQSEKDTGLVKLWAASSERISEKFEDNIEAQYGVISNNYDMRVYPSFSWNDTSMGYASVHDFAGVTNIFNNKAELRRPGFYCVVKNRVIQISLPDKDEIKCLKIFSLDGKQIAELDPSSFKKGSIYLIPLKEILSCKKSAMVLLIVEGKKGRWTQKVWIRN